MPQASKLEVAEVKDTDPEHPHDKQLLEVAALRSPNRLKTALSHALNKKDTNNSHQLPIEHASKLVPIPETVKVNTEELPKEGEDTIRTDRIKVQLISTEQRHSFSSGGTTGMVSASSPSKKVFNGVNLSLIKAVNKFKKQTKQVRKRSKLS